MSEAGVAALRARLRGIRDMEPLIRAVDLALAGPPEFRLVEVRVDTPELQRALFEEVRERVEAGGRRIRVLEAALLGNNPLAQLESAGLDPAKEILWVHGLGGAPDAVFEELNVQRDPLAERVGTLWLVVDGRNGLARLHARAPDFVDFATARLEVDVFLTSDWDPTQHGLAGISGTQFPPEMTRLLAEKRYGECVAWLEGLLATTNLEEERLKIRRDLAIAVAFAGNPVQGWGMLAAVADEARESGQSGVYMDALAARQALWTPACCPVVEAEQALTEFAELLESVGGPVSSRLLARVSWNFYKAAGRRSQQRGALKTLISLCRKLQIPVPTEDLAELAELAAQAGDVRDAVHWGERALQQAQKQKDILREARASHFLAQQLERQGERRRARALLTRARALSLQVKDPMLTLSLGMAELSSVIDAHPREDHAARIRALVDAAQESGSRDLQFGLLILLAKQQITADRLSMAEDTLQQAEALIPSLTDPGARIQHLDARATLAIHRNQIGTARVLLEEARTLADKLQRAEEVQRLSARLSEL